MTYPPTGPTPSQPTGESYGAGQYGAPQQGAPQYGQHGDQQQYGAPQYGGHPQGGQQYGAPQYGGQQGGGYPVAPQAYGNAPWSDRRPGSATAAGVMGIIFTALGFLGAAVSVVVLTGAAEASLFAQAGIDGFPLVLTIISAVALLVASVIGFIGAIQLLSGKSNKLLLLGTYIYLGSQLLSLIANLMFTGGDDVATTIVSSLIGVVLGVVLIVLARSSDVQQWLARKNAQQAAGQF